MYAIGFKILRVFFLGFLPLLFISSTGNDVKKVPLVLSGTYVLDVEGKSDYQLTGEISFSYRDKRSSTGSVFSILKLHFNGSKAVLPHNMEVVVCKGNTTDSLPLGNYKVNIVESFLNPSDGVFGAFSSDTLSEKLFFTKKGSIRITHFCNSGVKGTMTMVLLNQQGETININGDFDER